MPSFSRPPQATPDRPARPAPGELAPIIPITQGQKRRDKREAPQTPQSIDCAAEARTQAEGERGRVHLRVLGDMVREGRLASADLFAMVRLGIVTDHVEMLPCADPHRSHNASDWERQYTSQNAPGKALPSPSKVGCPLMAQVATSGTAPACVEALHLRAQIPRWRPGKGFEREPLDAADPVLQHELRPCLLLSRELFRHVLIPICQDEPV